jgi:hypothetical protein
MMLDRSRRHTQVEALHRQIQIRPLKSLLAWPVDSACFDFESGLTGWGEKPFLVIHHHDLDLAREYR